MTYDKALEFVIITSALVAMTILTIEYITIIT